MGDIVKIIRFIFFCNWKMIRDLNDKKASSLYRDDAFYYSLAYVLGIFLNTYFG
ncbi:hypothetical protein HMPREF3182_00445 [Megasphaera hutchinsoni]|uniref:Uncharacterized protein n=1 Tax=Megasphaera hutchinsoni TaxID=1588748 RepID=A0A134CJE3_9FIRM|nr:hypothetical protein HMPREF3182_00445 [Megasphaera hutchinsoni]